ncbi:MarR family transcriptional regulator [Mycolicibacterium mucogenicum]|uniref:MarR family winged helix-turn-helix transcriptional regulator n=1 Tax=Mycolicibacterium mucogenicum TaxID=56689 RepID=UPI002269B064|nr:MarR family transcriptional regulator [Mycolicibacterium mucogenicum]MCX8562009.1 MarR family transcriptional regulator [Mycolicibacterium mucogenicum]
MPSASSPQQRGGVAFLLAQLGHHAAQLFAERLAAVKLTPPHAGILRMIASQPGLSQQELSGHLGLLPSRVVTYVDELEGRGEVERRRNPNDRRLYALYLTASGEKLMQAISEIAREHEQALTVGLTAQQRKTLDGLLATLAEQQGLTPAVHPGFRQLGRRQADT